MLFNMGLVANPSLWRHAELSNKQRETDHDSGAASATPTAGPRLHYPVGAQRHDDAL